MDNLNILLNFCGHILDDNRMTLGGLFLIGLVGSVSHCTGMCGPFVITQIAHNFESIPIDKMKEWKRMTGGLLLFYHLGRALTYSFLGGVTYIFFNIFKEPYLYSFYQILSSFSLVIASIILLLTAWQKTINWTPHLPIISKFLDRNFQKIYGRVQPLPARWSNLILGLLLGFLPCGLVYSALLIVTHSRSLGFSIGGMISFTVGTVPSLMIVGIFGQILGNRLRQYFLSISPWLMTINALVLLLIAWQEWR
jgi:sulfite exporter TauE/SafE